MTHISVPLARLAPAAGFIARRIWRAFAALEMAVRVAAERRALALLDERALKDIGYTPGDAWAEAHRPFWDLPIARLGR